MLTAAEGLAVRATVPRQSMASYEASPGRPDPVEVLVEQGRSRVQELLPLRWARMVVSPFTFFRGAAAVMATDLAARPSTPLQVQLCGDAHLANFGGFAAPDRTMVFDLNDFDETAPGPFEWDLCRLVTSVVVAGRDAGHPVSVRRGLATRCVRAYAEAMEAFAVMSRLDVWYERMDTARLRSRFGDELGRLGVRSLDKAEAKARARTSSKAFARYTRRAPDGSYELVGQPPQIATLEDLLDGAALDRARARMHTLLDGYRSRLQEDRQHLLDGYRTVGVARKAVGVGSVGTRCWIVLLAAEDDDTDTLVLQVKEAQRSVLDPHLGTSRHENQGERVVAGQRLMQATGDALLGWDRAPGLDGVERDFYVRQLWDWKMSVDLDGFRRQGFAVYAELCGWTLARAHARSGDRQALAGYVGRGRALAEAMADFAESYADQNERDHAALVRAIDAGLLPVAADAG